MKKNELSSREILISEALYVSENLSGESPELHPDLVHVLEGEHNIGLLFGAQNF